LGLVVPAAALGLAFGPIEAILDLPAREAEGTGVVLLGLIAAVAGLALGWLVSRRPDCSDRFIRGLNGDLPSAVG